MKIGLKKRNWKKETARDFLALGSWVFYVLVIARAAIGPYWGFVYQLLIAAVVLSLLLIFVKNSEDYLARGLILVVFTILFYNVEVYTYFAILAMFGLIISSRYTGGSWVQIIKGLILGIVSSVVAYVSVLYIVV